MPESNIGSSAETQAARAAHVEFALYEWDPFLISLAQRQECGGEILGFLTVTEINEGISGVSTVRTIGAFYANQHTLLSEFRPLRWCVEIRDLSFYDAGEKSLYGFEHALRSLCRTKVFDTGFARLPKQDCVDAVGYKFDKRTNWVGLLIANGVPILGAPAI